MKTTFASRNYDFSGVERYRPTALFLSLLLLACITLPGCSSSEEEQPTPASGGFDISTTDPILDGEDQGGITLVYDVLEGTQDTEVEVDMDKMVAAIRDRVDPGGDRGVSVQDLGDGEIAVHIPGITKEEVEQQEGRPSGVSLLEFRVLAHRDVDQELIELALQSDGKEIFRPDSDEKFGWWVPIMRKEEDKFPEPGDLESDSITRRTEDDVLEVLVINDGYNITGSQHLESARPDVDQDLNRCISFTLNSNGSFLFAQLTSKYHPDEAKGRRRYLGIILRGEMKSAPAIHSTIRGSAQITGDFTQEEISDLVAVLDAGSLPTHFSSKPVRIIEWNDDNEPEVVWADEPENDDPENGPANENAEKPTWPRPVEDPYGMQGGEGEETYAQIRDRIFDEVGEPLFDNPESLVQLPGNDPVYLTPDRKSVIFLGVVCQRQTLLEMFICMRDTTEHESAIAADVRPFLIQAGLLATGAEPGMPIQFSPSYLPPTGPVVDILLRWKDEEGETREMKAQDWVRNTETGEAMTESWVWTGSYMIEPRPEPETADEYHLPPQSPFAADHSGNIITIANFASAIMDLPISSTDSNDYLSYETFTEHIPPDGTPITVILTPRQKETPVEQTPAEETPDTDTSQPEPKEGPTS